MFYKGINAKVFRRSIAFAIAVVVTSRSSSFDYTKSVHAVHAGAERNVCNIVVSTETPKPPPIHLKRCPRVQTSTLTPAPLLVLTSKTPQPLAQPFAQMRYRCKYKVSSTGPNKLEVYIIYLHVYMCQYMRFCHLSHVPRLILACASLKFHQNFHVLTHIHVDNDIHFKYIWAGRLDLIHTSVAHLRKRLS